MNKRDEIYAVIKNIIDESKLPEGLTWEDVETVIDILREHIYDEDRTSVRKKINEVLDAATERAYNQRREKNE